MLKLSAPDCIAPAVTRTRNFLFRPFNFWTFVKLSLVAAIAEQVSFSGNTSIPTHGVNSIPSITSIHDPSVSTIIWIVAIVLILTIPLALFIMYLVTRLQFAFFHCLAHGVKFIRPAWQRYKSQAWRFFLLRIVIGLVVGLVCLLIAAPFAWSIYKSTQNSSIGPWDILAIAVPIILIAIPLAIFLYLVEITLRDFLLPHIAIEDLSVREAWHAVKQRITAEKGQFALYAFFRAILPFFTMMFVGFIALIPLGIVAVGSWAAAEGLNSILDTTILAQHVLAIFIDIIFGLLVVAVWLLLAIFLAGPIATWIRAYALYFYGGRYQRLGNILSPPQPPAFNPE
jgi:hypothetical protein